MSSSEISWHELAGLRYLESHAGQTTAASPIVVILHSMGATPEQMLELYRPCPIPARLIIPRGPLPFMDGFSWLERESYRQPLSQQAATIRSRAGQVAALLAELSERYPAAGRPSVTGISQGGDLSFALAVHHPELIAAALPFAGRWPAEFRPEVPSTALRPPVSIFNGGADEIVTAATAHAAAEWFSAQGYPTQLFIDPDTGHDISAAMRERFYAVLGPAEE